MEGPSFWESTFGWGGARRRDAERQRQIAQLVRRIHNLHNKAADAKSRYHQNVSESKQQRAEHDRRHAEGKRQLDIETKKNAELIKTKQEHGKLKEKANYLQHTISAIELQRGALDARIRSNKKDKAQVRFRRCALSLAC